MPINLADYIDLSLLLLRLIVAIIFIASGIKDLRNPDKRSQSTGMSRPFTLFLGTAEIAGGIGLVLGILTQFAAIGLILVMLGAIYKKMFVWKTGFWGEKGMGWHYDTMLLVMNLVIITTDGGRFV